MHAERLSVAPYEDAPARAAARRVEALARDRVGRPRRRYVGPPRAGFVPVLLHREDGSWRVDLAETWKNLFFGRDGDVLHRELDAALRLRPDRIRQRDAARRREHSISAATRSTSVLGRARRGRGALAEFLEGELLFRNCFRSVDALDRYEGAAQLAPRAPAFPRCSGIAPSTSGSLDLAISAYERLGEDAALDALAPLPRERATRSSRPMGAARAPKNRYDGGALRALAQALEAAGDAAGAAGGGRARAALVSAPPSGKTSRSCFASTRRGRTPHGRADARRRRRASTTTPSSASRSRTRAAGRSSC